MRGSDGAVLDPTPVTLGTIFAVTPHVEVLGSRWLVVWEQHPTHDNPVASVIASFIGADGTPAGAFTAVSISDARRPDLATGPNQGLIAYYHAGEVYARRIQPDGTLLDAAAGFAVTSAPNNQFLPSLAWDGAEYVVAYEDYRAYATLDKPISDIYATRVNDLGQVLDPNGFAIASTASPEIMPAVAALIAIGAAQGVVAGIATAVLRATPVGRAARPAPASHDRNR